MAFSSEKQRKEPVLEQQCSLSWLSGAHRTGNSAGVPRKQGEGGKHPERAAESASSPSRKIEPLKMGVRWIEGASQARRGEGNRWGASSQWDSGGRGRRKGWVGKESQRAGGGISRRRWLRTPVHGGLPVQPGPGKQRDTPARQGGWGGCQKAHTGEGASFKAVTQKHERDPTPGAKRPFRCFLFTVTLCGLQRLEDQQ